DLLSIDSDFAFVGPIITIENFAECAFASPILAEERVNLSRPKLDFLHVIGDERAEFLQDSPRFDERCIIPCGRQRYSSQLARWHGVCSCHGSRRAGYREMTREY